MPARFRSFSGAAADGGLGGGGDIGDHPVEHLRNEVVLVGEALVEVPQRHSGLSADAAHRQFGQVRVRAEDVQARFQEPAPAVGKTLGGFDPAVRPDLCHSDHLDTAVNLEQYQETHVLTFADRSGQ